MEEESEKLRQLQSEVDKQLSVPTSPNASLNMSFEEKMDVDNRSVYIGNVDYGATAEELEQHFHCYGSRRVLVQGAADQGDAKENKQARDLNNQP